MKGIVSYSFCKSFNFSWIQIVFYITFTFKSTLSLMSLMNEYNVRNTTSDTLRRDSKNRFSTKSDVILSIKLNQEEQHHSFSPSLNCKDQRIEIFITDEGLSLRFLSRIQSFPSFGGISNEIEQVGGETVLLLGIFVKYSSWRFKFYLLAVLKQKMLESTSFTSCSKWNF